MPKSIILREMKAEDIKEILSIECKVFPRSAWPRYFFEADIESDTTIKVSAVDGNKVIGYALGTVAEKELHITNIAVKIEYHRQKIGTRLVQWLEEKAIKSGCVESYLEVRITNKAAIKLYENLRYYIAHTRRHYYLDGEPAYIMKRKLQESSE